MTNTEQVVKPTIWNRLGFGGCPMPPQLSEAPHNIVTTYIGLNWRDWIRLCISGKLMIRTLTHFDKEVIPGVSLTAMSILPPDYKLPRRP